ncbi:MAG: hypothetical protein L6W00_22970 [Lentisphaeria bacterium]|nr:MAG: hypothetical protein L6W00_22970 [Lentisphaeria bacterium]
MPSPTVPAGGDAEFEQHGGEVDVFTVEGGVPHLLIGAEPERAHVEFAAAPMESGVFDGHLRCGFDFKMYLKVGDVDLACPDFGDFKSLCRRGGQFEEVVEPEV